MSLKISKGVLPKLQTLRVRDRIKHLRPFPPQLQTAIINHYKEIPWAKRGELKQLFSKKKSPTIYTKPVTPNIRQAQRFINDREKLQEVVAARYNEQMDAKKSVRQVDFVMYRSLPNLYYIGNRMFAELKAFDKDFSPYSMLDMGHNLGSMVWAGQQFYGESIGDYVIHEHTKDEYDRTIKLLNNKYQPHIENVTVKGRFSMPRTRGNLFDVVTAVNYFPYLQDNEVKEWLKKIWARTGKYLIIADISNRYTALRMARIRNLFINVCSEEGHILAPCPHAQACPMLKNNNQNVCRFMQKNTKISAELLPEDKALFNHQRVEYTYLILKRGPQEAESKFARLLAPVSFHTHSTHPNLEMLTCNSDGSLWKANVNKMKSPNLYQYVAGKQTGDLIDQNWWDHPFTPGTI